MGTPPVAAAAAAAAAAAVVPTTVLLIPLLQVSFALQMMKGHLYGSMMAWQRFRAARFNNDALRAFRKSMTLYSFTIHGSWLMTHDARLMIHDS